MALLVLVSSTGFSIDLHYCQGKVKSFSFFGEAQSCHQPAKVSHCSKKRKACHAPISDQTQVEDCKKNCCTNQTLTIASNEEAKQLESSEITAQDHSKQLLPILLYNPKWLSTYKTKSPYLNHIPPLLNKNLRLLIQTFLL